MFSPLGTLNTLSIESLKSLYEDGWICKHRGMCMSMRTPVPLLFAVLNRKFPLHHPYSSQSVSP